MAYEFRYISGKPDAAKRNCKDCRHLKGYVSLWCTNEAARKEFGPMPGTSNCRHWEGMLPYVAPPWWKFWDWNNPYIIKVKLP